MNKHKFSKISYSIYAVIICALFFVFGWIASTSMNINKTDTTVAENTNISADDTPSNNRWTKKVVIQKTFELPYFDSRQQGKTIYDYIKSKGWTQLDANWFKLGMSLYEGKHYEEAIEVFNIALSNNPHSDQKFPFWVWKGLLLDLLNRREDAIAAYQKALDMPTAKEAKWSYYQFGDLVMKEEAVKQWINNPFQREEGAPPKKETIILMNEIHALGKIYDLQKAVKLYKKAQTIKGREHKWIWWMSIAFSFFVNHEYEKALQALEAQNTNHHDSWLVSPILVWQGHVLDLMNRREDAVSRYKKALEIFPKRIMRNDKFSIVVNRSWIKQCIIKPFTINVIKISREIENMVEPTEESKLVALKNKASEYNIANDLIWLKLGVFLLQAGKAQEALKCFQKSEKVTDEQYDWRYHIMAWKGCALDCLNQREKAKVCYQRALKNFTREISTPQYYPVNINREWLEKRINHSFDSKVFDKSEQKNTYFTPGNLVISDCHNDRLIEIRVGTYLTEVTQVITWPTEKYSRRRPLGITFAPNGYLYVGITAVPPSGEDNPYPEGIAEILCISPSGKKTFLKIPQDYLKKAVWLNSKNPRNVYLMSNNPTQNLPIKAYRLGITGFGAFSNMSTYDIRPFTVSRDKLSNGRPLPCESGLIYVPSDKEQCIQVFDENGGEPIRTINTKANYHFISHIETSDHLLALTKSEPGMPPNEIHQIDLDGNVLDRCELKKHDIQSVWNLDFLKNASNEFAVVDYSPTSQSKNNLFIFNANDLKQSPRILPIIGKEVKNLTKNKYFDIQRVP